MTKKVIGRGTIDALEQVRELMNDDDHADDADDDERQPNLTLTDACIELVDSYDGDTTEDDLSSLLDDPAGGRRNRNRAGAGCRLAR